MCQVFPHRCHLAEGLRGSLAPDNGGKRRREHTSLILCWPPLGNILTRLIWTFEPSRVPSYTYPEMDGRLMFRRESFESIHDLGSTSLATHTSTSSCNNSRDMAFVGSKIPARAYAILSGKLGKMVWRLTPSRYSTSHVRSSPCRFGTALRYSLPRRQLLSCLGNCGEDVSRSRSCCRGLGWDMGMSG